jgi:hypothetical protein
MKSDCIVISSSSNDEIEIFEDDEVTAEEKNKATCDLHDLGIPVYGRPKATWNVIPFSDNVAWCVPYCRLTKCVKLCCVLEVTMMRLKSLKMMK